MSVTNSLPSKMVLKMFLFITAVVFHCHLSFVFGEFVNHHPWDDPDYFIEADQDEFKGEIMVLFGLFGLF